MAHNITRHAIPEQNAFFSKQEQMQEPTFLDLELYENFEEPDLRFASLIEPGLENNVNFPQNSIFCN
jgi:hypothetical protein